MNEIQNGIATPNNSPPLQSGNTEKSVFRSAEFVSHNTGSDRKRNRRALLTEESSVDDILGQITSKLGGLTTTEDSTHEDKINAFIDVLGCARSESEFYLESSNWDIETAVVLWLENNPPPSRSGTMNRNMSTNEYINQWPPAPPHPILLENQRNAMMNGYYEGNRSRWYQRQIPIEGLDPDWRAEVDPAYGCIRFVHQPSGVIRFTVPEGFADNTEIDVTSMNHAANGNGHQNGIVWPPPQQQNSNIHQLHMHRPPAGKSVDMSGSFVAGGDFLSKQEQQLQQQWALPPPASAMMVSGTSAGNSSALFPQGINTSSNLFGADYIMSHNNGYNSHTRYETPLLGLDSTEVSSTLSTEDNASHSNYQYRQMMRGEEGDVGGDVCGVSEMERRLDREDEDQQQRCNSGGDGTTAAEMDDDEDASI